MIPKDAPPEAAREKTPQTPPGQERGTNAVEHEPDPTAEPSSTGEGKYAPRGPYTTGND